MCVKHENYMWLNNNLRKSYVVSYIVTLISEMHTKDCNM